MTDHRFNVSASLLDERTFRANASWRGLGVFVEVPEDEIEQILLTGESETLEFKEKLEKSGPEKIAKTATAFANTKGGTIVFGVDDDICTFYSSGRSLLFENILSELRKLDRNQGGISIPIQMPLDDDGYFDRRCPSAACQSGFKVLFEDWKDKVSDIRVFCPICREEAKATEWNTPEQCEYIKQVGIQHVRGIVDKAMSRDAREFNSQTHPGFIQISMAYKPGAPPLVVPFSAAEELRQKFACEQCGCRYSSLGAAFFCPACGHNSAEKTCSQMIETVRKSLAALLAIRKAVRTVAGPDAAENTVRQILENNMVRMVGAFQSVAEALFDRTPGAGSIPRRKNVFQSLAEGSALWRKAAGKGYDDLLSPAEMADLLRFFQQRHLLAHCEGMVDQDYINRSGDRTYSVGQRLVIREGAVNRAIGLASRLMEELRKRV